MKNLFSRYATNATANSEISHVECILKNIEIDLGPFYLKKNLLHVLMFVLCVLGLSTYFPRNDEINRSFSIFVEKNIERSLHALFHIGPYDVSRSRIFGYLCSGVICGVPVKQSYALPRKRFLQWLLPIKQADRNTQCCLSSEKSRYAKKDRSLLNYSKKYHDSQTRVSGETRRMK